MKTILDLRNSVGARALKHNTADHDLRVRCLTEAGEQFQRASALETTMAYLKLYDSRFVPYVCEDLYFAGAAGNFRLPEVAGLTDDIGHFCPNYQKLVEQGVTELRRQVLETRPTTPEQARVKQAYLDTMDLFVSYMQKHARRAEEMAADCQGETRDNLLRMAHDIDYICKRRPATFMQGLQLVFFAHAYVFVKPHTNTITFGNLDRVFEPLYLSDRAVGTLTRDSALEMICHFYLALSFMERDTQNIVLGGSDENGGYFENDLTVLFMEGQKILHFEQPSVSLKIRSDTSDAVWDAALDLLSKGGGMPSFLNDSLIIRSLVRAGFSQKEANTFCNVGCYEATPYGNTFGGTVSGIITLVEVFAKFFAQDAEYDTFDDFLNAWEAFLQEQYLTVYLPSFAARRENIRTHSASTFLGLILDGCTERLKLPEQCGAQNNIFSVNLGGIGTVTDSLLCVKHFVYDTQIWTLPELRRQVAENYPDGEALALLRSYPVRFGSGDAYSNQLAAREAQLLASLVTDHPFDREIKMLPSLFHFTGDILADEIPATPDGRRAGDRYSYGVAGSELLARRDTTKLLLSAVELPLELFPIGAPMTVNLAAEFLKTQKGRSGVRTMVETFLKEGGFHIQINIADPEVLRDAQKHPEQYKDLLIRISGHTEPFIRLNAAMQEALIARAEMGC